MGRAERLGSSSWWGVPAGLGCGGAGRSVRQKWRGCVGKSLGMIDVTHESLCGSRCGRSRLSPPWHAAFFHYSEWQ